MGKTTKKGIDKKKLTLAEFVWYGFNFTVGISFIGGFAFLSNVNNPGTGKNPLAIGANAIWVFLLTGLLAAVVAWAFAKMARVHHSSNNGAAYIYTRSSFGIFTGYLILFLQYVTMPFLITLQILFLMKGTFGQGYVGNSPVAIKGLGSFSDLYLDLIGIAIYGAAAFSIFLGMKAFKYANNITSIIKWGTSSLMIIAGIYLAIKYHNLSGSNGYWNKSVSDGGGSQISLSGVINAFNVIFFYYAGFETFSTAGQNIENPERNIGLGIMLVMLSCTIFYIVVSLIFFAGFAGRGIGDQNNGKSFVQNMIIGTWTSLPSGVKWAGIGIMIASALAMKIQIASQNALYGGTSLQPLAKEGFIPDYFKKLGKDNLPIRASVLNIGITVILIILWLIIPDFLVGLKVVTPDQMASSLNLNSFSSISAGITIFIYAMVVLALINLAIKKQMAMAIWEWIVFPIAMVFLAFVVVYHYYNLISTVAVAHPTRPKIIAVVIELFFISAVVAIAITIYFTYYRKKYRARLKTNPEVQERLNYEFRVVDDWEYVSNHIKSVLDSYMVRNVALHHNRVNDNYIFAEQTDKKMQKIKKEYDKKREERMKHDEEHVEV